MDGKYDINSMAFSLKTMCAVKIVRQVLLASGIRFKCDEDLSIHGLSTVVNDATERVRKLKLPQVLSDMLGNLIGPMEMQLSIWYRKFYRYRCGDPILTPHGTVDCIRSANAILLNEKSSTVTRFVIASDHCMEDVIYELFKGLNKREKDILKVLHRGKLSSPFIYFWRRVISGDYGRSKIVGRLPESAYDEGFKLAWKQRNDVAMRHFLNKVSPWVLSKCIDHLDTSCFPGTFGNLSPATFCLYHSKISQRCRPLFLPMHANDLLHLLLLCPYQCFFMEAAHSLINHLSDMYYWELAEVLLEKVVSNASNGNLRNCFTAFWAEGSGHRSGSDELSYLSIISILFKLEDEPLLDFVLAETCAELKKALLTKTHGNKIWRKFITEKKFRMVDLLINGCGELGEDVLLEFKSKIFTDDCH